MYIQSMSISIYLQNLQLICFIIEFVTIAERLLQGDSWHSSIYHMNEKHYDDIGYNFLIGSDGNVLVGRGWEFAGAHTQGYNSDSVGIAFVGNFQGKSPTSDALSAAEHLINYGVEIKKISDYYKGYDYKQLAASTSPGEEMYLFI